jgi:hypothetical protein
MVKNQNGSATMTISAGSFAAVVVGDTVFIPGLTTGDTAGPFNALNEGFWVVIGKLSNTSLTLTRLAGVTFQAASEAPVLTANSQLQAFSATGVQLGDAVSISAGFSTTTQSTYAVYTVTPGWFEVLASRALPLETSIIPGTTGMLFYSAAKRFVRLETDQPCIIQFNGDTGTTGQLAPWSAGDPTLVAWSERVGPTFQVTVVSASLVPANITFVSAE